MLQHKHWIENHKLKHCLVVSASAVIPKNVEKLKHCFICDASRPYERPWMILQSTTLGSLRYLSHRTRVTHDMRSDIAWWLDFMDCFNGLTKIVDFHPAAPLAIDACTETACAHYMDHMFYTSWKQYWSNAAAPHINYKEALALEPAAMARIPLWDNKHIWVHCDNKGAVYTINNPDSKVHGANMG